MEPETQPAQTVPSMQPDAVLSVDRTEPNPTAAASDEIDAPSDAPSDAASSRTGRFRIDSSGGDLHTEHRSGTYTEAFYDLIYFIPLARLTSQPPSSQVLSRFPLYFAAIFFAWKGEAFFNTRFDPDNVSG